MRLFITGTDTGVGKTWVTANLARYLHARSRKVAAWKPIETGCTGAPYDRTGEDAELLATSAGNWQVGQERGYLLLRDPLAPKVAAENEHRTIDLREIQTFAKQLESRCEDFLVEGAGGWRVPICEGADMANFATALGYPVLVVARASLGTINHTILTVEAIRSDGCQIAAVVLSMRNETLETVMRNQLEISRVIGIPVHRISEHDRSCLGAISKL